MFALISSAVKIAFLISSYATILIYLSQMTGYFLATLTDLFANGVPELVGYTLFTTISTLNWIFTPALIELAMTIWLVLPAIRLTIYIYHKFVWIS